MKYLFYIIALLLMLAWIIGYFIFKTGDLIHVLLAVSFLLTLMQVARIKNK